MIVGLTACIDHIQNSYGMSLIVNDFQCAVMVVCDAIKLEGELLDSVRTSCGLEDTLETI